MIQLYQSKTSAGDRRLAMMVAAAIVLFNAAVFPFAHVPLHQVTPFLPVILVALFCVEGLTATLFLQQFVAGAGVRSGILGAAYLFSCSVIAPLAFTYPGAFAPHGLLQGTPQTATWLWVAWHTGAALFICVYAAASRFPRTGAMPSGRRLFVLVLASAMCASSALITAVAVQGPSWMPRVIVRGDYHALLTSGVGVGVWLATAAALVSFVAATRGRTLVSLWVGVALLTDLLLITITLKGGARFSVGWYASQFESLLSAGFVISALLRESGRIFVSALRNSRAALSKAERIAQLASWTLDLETGQISCSDTLFTIFALPVHVGPVDRRIFFDHVEPEDLRAFDRDLEAARTAGTFTGDQRIVRADGERRWIHTQGQYIAGEDGAPAQVFGTTIDVTERKQAEEALIYLAHHDPLTGLANRVLLALRMHDALEAASRRSALVAVLVVDLDLFKSINDALGHAVGDQFLTVLAGRLQARAIEADAFIARTGGDEFAVVVPVGDAAAANDVARTIVETCRMPIQIAERVLASTASVGIALYPADGSTPDDLLRAADTAMYQAKDDGRDRARSFTAEMHDLQIDRLGIEADLRLALERGELTVHYQPLVSALDGAVRGVEALVRWYHPVRGSVPPDAFIGIAETSGLIGTLGRQLLASALRDRRACAERTGFDIPFAVNVSPLELDDPHFASSLAEALAANGVAPSSLKLEVTEGAVISDRLIVGSSLTQLRKLGVQISIDDFGTGYSSLGRLKSLPIDELKLDRSFVRNIATSPVDRAIADSVVRLGHSMGLRVVAEGVETEAQASVLRASGCDLLQGYFFGRPMPIDDLIAYLEVRMEAQASV